VNNLQNILKTFLYSSFSWLTEGRWFYRVAALDLLMKQCTEDACLCTW